MTTKTRKHDPIPQAAAFIQEGRYSVLCPHCAGWHCYPSRSPTVSACDRDRDAMIYLQPVFGDPPPEASQLSVFADAIHLQIRDIEGLDGEQREACEWRLREARRAVQTCAKEARAFNRAMLIAYKSRR